MESDLNVILQKIRKLASSEKLVDAARLQEKAISLALDIYDKEEEAFSEICVSGINLYNSTAMLELKTGSELSVTLEYLKKVSGI
jgi:hypothetical protein